MEVKVNYFMVLGLICMFLAYNSYYPMFIAIPLGDRLYGDSMNDSGTYYLLRYDTPGLLKHQRPSAPVYWPEDLPDYEYYGTWRTKSGENLNLGGVKASQIVVTESIKVKGIGVGTGIYSEYLGKWIHTIPRGVIYPAMQIFIPLYSDKGDKPYELVHVFHTAGFGRLKGWDTNIQSSEEYYRSRGIDPEDITEKETYFSSNPLRTINKVEYDYTLHPGVYWIAVNPGSIIAINKTAEVPTYCFGIANEYSGWGVRDPETPLNWGFLRTVEVTTPYPLGRIMAHIEGEAFIDVEAYNSVLDITNVPDTIYVGETFTLDALLTNTGGLTWNITDTSLGITPGSHENDESVWGKLRLTLLNDTKYNDTTVINETLTAPLDEGNYTLVMQMVHDEEDPTWFGDVYMKKINVKNRPGTWNVWNQAPPNSWFNIVYRDGQLTLEATFPSDCYRVADWGEIYSLNNSVYVADLVIEKLNDDCVPSENKVSHTYTTTGLEGEKLMLYSNGILFGTVVVSETDATILDPAPVNSIKEPETIEPLVFGVSASWFWLLTFIFFVATVITWNNPRFYRILTVSKR